MTRTIPAGSALLPVYATMPLRAVSGRGSWLIDEEGQQWLDAYGGHAVAATGHCHPEVVRAIREQAGELIFYSTAVPHHAREHLANLLVEHCPVPLARVFFCNSGAEANENALGLARRHTGRSQVVSVAGGWHGRTAATQAVTDGARYEETARLAGLPVSRKVAFNDVAAMRAAVDESVAAVIVEPVQGLTGARDCSPEFLQAARAACDATGALLIFDEIQCGAGRCGTFTAAESYGVVPDLLTLAKGLASGLPIGAVITTDTVSSRLSLGDLGSTFGGGPVPCAAAIATVRIMVRQGFLANVVRVGDALRSGAAALRGVTGVQGRGLLTGIRLERPAVDIQRALFARRILTGTSGDPHVLRLMPPLTLSPSEADLILMGLREALA